MLTIRRISELSDGLVKHLQDSFPDVQWDEEHLDEFLRSPANILLVADQNGRGCGIVRAHSLPRYDMRKKEILLHGIDVLPEYQRQGIATALVEKLKEIAREEEASEIWVITSRSNTAAMNLYQATGGHPDGDGDTVVLIYDF